MSSSEYHTYFPQHSDTDVVVIGAGPNGLIAAAYLSAAGLDVTLVERRYEIGGGLATEEILFPHHYANTHASYHYMVDYLPPITDFDLPGTGFRYRKPAGQIGGVFGDECVYFSSSLEDSRDFLASFSIDQADTFGNLATRFRKLVDGILAPATYLSPDAPVDLSVALQRTEVGEDLLRISEQSALEIIDEYALRDSVKAALMYTACQWGISPRESGMGFLVPLLVDRGMQKAFVYGGSHRLASALARVILRQGGMIVDNAEVVQIVTDGERATGVLLEDGQQINARKAVLSSLDPQSTFLRLLPAEVVPDDLKESAQAWTWDKWSILSVFFATKGKPTWRDDPKNTMIGLPDPFLTVLGFDGKDDVVSFLEGIESGQIPKAAGHFTCETAFDNSLSQLPDEHVSFFSMPAPYDFPWDEEGGRLVEDIVGLLDANFDGFQDSIVQTVVETPRMVEQRLPNMVRGSIKHGDYNPIQMGYMRPNPQCSSSRTPVPGLYLCGASVFPGGMVIGGPGYIAAQMVCEDAPAKFPYEYPAHVQQYLDTYFPEGRS